MKRWFVVVKEDLLFQAFNTGQDKLKRSTFRTIPPNDENDFTITNKYQPI